MLTCITVACLGTAVLAEAWQTKPTSAPPTFVPLPPQCEDRLLPGGEEWHLSWGPQYNCTWFELEPRSCERYGWRDSVYTAKEACCVCEGGLGTNETNVPATAEPPTPAPPTSTPYDPQCRDKSMPGGEEWHLTWGPQYNCAWFDLSPVRCEWYTTYSNAYTANDACCACGGGLGVDETSAPPTAAPPTPAPPTYAPYDPQCEDRLLPGGEEWHLSWGPQYNCSWFEVSPVRCGQYVPDYSPYTANVACCVCGGGGRVNGTNANTTPSA